MKLMGESSSLPSPFRPYQNLLPKCNCTLDGRDQVLVPLDGGQLSSDQWLPLNNGNKNEKELLTQ